MPTASTPDRDAAGRRVVRVVFTALLLDLMAFTMPLPLFPRIIEDFVRTEAAHPSLAPTLLSQTMTVVRTLRANLFSLAAPASIGAACGDALSAAQSSQWDLTLLGGLLASLFSFCQFLISPAIGRLSDRYGRRRVLLATMAGNVASAALWLFADRFEVYALSRVVGGLSEGNVQLSIAAITDVTTPATRARSLALVGAAFSLAFTVGPSIGAYLSQRAFAHASVVNLSWLGEVHLNAYAVPAAMTLALLAFETAYLALYLPETRGWHTEGDDASAEVGTDEKSAATEPSQPVETLSQPSSAAALSSSLSTTPAAAVSRLGSLSVTHFLFLFFFAGAEFTLCFLTHALFRFTNAQNGRLLGFVGLLSAALQGGYVRRRRAGAGAGAAGTAQLAERGMHACALALAALAALPHLAPGPAATGALWAAAALLAFVSASVVNSLNALASLAAPRGHGAGAGAGAALGRFRSAGQLGRALGPLATTAVYWSLGPTTAYAAGAVGVAVVARRMAAVRRAEERVERGARDKRE
ncbi:hypothetical protein JCM3770_002086 [Rhodotorula araucariae]